MKSWSDYLVTAVGERLPRLEQNRHMGLDPIKAQFARQGVLDAKARSRAAGREFNEESIRNRESGNNFYGSLALFSGGTIALSVTYLGYLKSTRTGPVLYPRVLIASWIVLLLCVVTSLFSVLLSSYYTHFVRLRFYVESLKEEYETMVDEMDNLIIVNVTTQAEKDVHKKRYAEGASAKDRDIRWATKREAISSALWTTFGWVARLGFPIGLGLLMFFAVKNI